MQATIKSTQSNAKQLDKEITSTLGLVARVDGKLSKVVDARFYMSRSADGAGPVYCNVWVHGATGYTSGRGKASGYGYHKTSAAMSDAIGSAGFTLDKEISGVGSDAMREACLAMAVAMGCDVSEYLFV